MSRRPVLTADNLRAIREVAAQPRWKRKPSLFVLADLLGVSYGVVVRAARNEQRCYREVATEDTHRVSRGLATPGRVMTERGVRRPVALSVASSAGTPGITGGACGAETRHHERTAETRGESGNAGAAGGGHP